MFDPYHRWLGIPKEEQPPTFYQILAISPKEQDADVIDEAAIRQTTHVRAYQIGAHSAECTRILKEISQARITLLNPAKRKEYDEQLARAGKPSAAVSAPAQDGAALESAVQVPAAFALPMTTRRPSNSPAPARGSQSSRGLGKPAIIMSVAVAVFLILAAVGAVIGVIYLTAGTEKKSEPPIAKLPPGKAQPLNADKNVALQPPKDDQAKDKKQPDDVAKDKKQPDDVAKDKKQPDDVAKDKKQPDDEAKTKKVDPPPDPMVVTEPKIEPKQFAMTTWVGYLRAGLPVRVRIGDVAAEKFTGLLSYPALDGGDEVRTQIQGTITGETLAFSYQRGDIENDAPIPRRRFTGQAEGGAIHGSWEESGGVEKGSCTLHRVAADTDWAQLDTTDKPTIKDGYLHSGRHEDPKSPAYSTGTHLIKGPVEITAVFRTEGNNVRFHAFKGSAVVLNWDARKEELRVNRPDGSDGKLETGSAASLRVRPLSPNTWYKMRWRITDKGMEVLIDDQLVFREKKNYVLSTPTAIRISNGDGLDIKSFRVTPLDPKKAVIALPTKPANPNGVVLPVLLDRAKMPVHYYQVGKNFNISKSWILSLDFVVTDQSNDPRFIFFWGDERPGKDPIVLCLADGELRASVDNTVDGTGHGMACPFPKSMLGKWVSVVYCYDAPTKELELYLDGTLVARDRCAITPMVDRPMQAYVGGATPTDPRFQGKVRSLSLSNR